VAVSSRDSPDSGLRASSGQTATLIGQEFQRAIHADGRWCIINNLLLGMTEGRPASLQLVELAGDWREEFLWLRHTAQVMDAEAFEPFGNVCGKAGRDNYRAAQRG
jgi:hypothetical protein